ncbi:SIR2 family protein [Enterococcus faecalis]
MDDLVKDNNYPIIFIGSGMSKRYLKNFPSWNELLKEYWQKIGEKENFFSHLRNIKSNIDIQGLSEDEKDFYANTTVASYIEKKYDDMFYSEKIKVDGLDIDTAYTQNISPFKFDLAERFSHLDFKDGIEDELEAYTDFLAKARVIITTNYDSLTENLLSKRGIQPKIYVGQNGFFDKTIDWSELYKIHGDVKDPKSIIINKDDYTQYDKNSILISAKILSNMIEAPIMFLGYSLTDRNVRKLLKDFASQLPKEDVRKSSNRIFIIEYLKNEHDVIEQMNRDEQLDIGYILASTDNYSKIFHKITKIDEGLTPYEVRKYQKIIKKIVDTAGATGNLDAVLVSSTELESLEKQIHDGKPIVVALGNRKYMYVFPDLVSYITDYLKEEHSIMPTVALEFIAKENPGTRTPFARYIKNEDINKLEISEDCRVKIRKKIDLLGTLEKTTESVPKNCKQKFNSITDILNTPLSMGTKINLITYNVGNLDKEDLTEYILNDALSMFNEACQNKQQNLKSVIRRLFFAYDLLINGDLKN